MTVKEFIKKYKEAVDAKKFLEERVTRKYVPYTEKISKLENLINKTSAIELADEREIFKQNSPARFLLYTMILIDSYVDVDINFAECTEEFDALSEENLIGALLGVIPENERKTFQMLHDMIQADYYENNRSLVGYLDGKVQAATMLIEEIIDKVAESFESNPEQYSAILEKMGIANEQD